MDCIVVVSEDFVGNSFCEVVFSECGLLGWWLVFVIKGCVSWDLEYLIGDCEECWNG